MVLNMDDYIKQLFTGQDITSEDITSETLKTLPFNVWENVRKGIELMKVKDGNRVMVFLCRFDKDAIFGRHLHSDMDEVCTVIYGILADKLTKEVKVRGESMSYSRGVPHEPYARVETLICVSLYY